VTKREQGVYAIARLVAFSSTEVLQKIDQVPICGQMKFAGSSALKPPGAEFGHEVEGRVWHYNSPRDGVKVQRAGVGKDGEPLD
jgi:hypothetical protein